MDIKKSDLIKVGVAVVAVIAAIVLVYLNTRPAAPEPIEPAPPSPDNVIPPREGGGVVAPGAR